jgi:hypothetical protein
MAITLMIPRYAHRPVSIDERLGRQVEDVMNPANPLPQQCSQCKLPGTPKSPLMMRPFFRTDSGGPRGTMYQAFHEICFFMKIRRS